MRTALIAKISVFAICVEAITHSFLYNLHECTFKGLRISNSADMSRTRAEVFQNIIKQPIENV